MRGRGAGEFVEDAMPTSEAIKRWVLLCGTWALGTMFITAAGLKALNMASFVSQIGRYRLLPHSLETPAAVLLILSESVLGIACLCGFHPMKALRAVIALLCLFLAATLLRWQALRDTDCNCFGPGLTTGPASVILHTILLIAIAGVLIMLARRTGVPTARRWLRVGAGTVAALFIMFVAQPFVAGSPSPVPPAAGDQVRIFLSATCGKCLSYSSKVQALSESRDVAAVRVFIGASYEQQVKDYLQNGNLQLEYTAMTFSQLARETTHVPRVQLLRAGKVLHDWDGEVPTVEEVKRALKTAPDSDTGP